MSSKSSFRSVWPHEPIPLHEKHGYVLLQGALHPCAVIIQHNNNVEGETAFCKTTLGDVLHDFWTSPQDLADRLSQVLQSSSTSFESNNPTFDVTDAQVLDDEPPYSKIRLTLTSPLEAWRLVQWGKAQKPSSADLLGNNNDAEDQNQISWPTKVLQWTRLTQQPMLPPDRAWNRSSPPKFRRLLPRPSDEFDHINLQQERAATRFLFVSNLLPPPPAYNDNDSIHEVLNVWTNSSSAVQAIRSVFEVYDTSGEGVEVFAAHARKLTQYCHVGFRTATDAQTALQHLQQAVVTWNWTTLDKGSNKDQSLCCSAQSSALFLDYAAVTDRSLQKAQLRAVGAKVPQGEPTRPECTSMTDHVQVPGLLVLPDFVSEAEEATLLAVVLGPHAPWAPSQRTPTVGGHVKRRVQHYGYVFDYQTADVLRDKTNPNADCPPMPQWINSCSSVSSDVDDNNNIQKKKVLFSEEAMAACVNEGRGWPVLAGLCERIRCHTFVVENSNGNNTAKLQFPQINQMTLNHYEPGEGIGSHVDTVSAFGNGILSLSLQSGIVMEFRQHSLDEETPKRKLVYLPPRSLCVMTGPARYDWEHMIVTRRTDTHQGKVLPRGVRVSLTFRTALDEDGCTPLPLLESANFPLRWGQDSQEYETAGRIGSAVTSSEVSLVTPECERRHVHDVYDAIAKQWHHTRGRRGVLWPGATQFLQQLPPGSLVADVGCGDGKYFPAIWEAGSFCIGTDISRPLLQTAFPSVTDIPEHFPESRRVSDKQKHLSAHPAVAVADCMNLPLLDDCCDAAICIAVLHHLSTHERRVQCLRELARVVRVGGLINVQAWAMEQEEGSRRKFASEDVFVPFNAQPKYLDLQTANSKMNKDNGAIGRREKQQESRSPPNGLSTAQVYSEAFDAHYDDRKGLVVFKRYCHLYRKGELEELVHHIPSLDLLEGGFESGNYYIILKVCR
jgi:alkylated DNA repair protein alkB family protein 8